MLKAHITDRVKIEPYTQLIPTRDSVHASTSRPFIWPVATDARNTICAHVAMGCLWPHVYDQVSASYEEKSFDA